MGIAGRQTRSLLGHAAVVSHVIFVVKWQQMSLPAQSSSFAQTMGYPLHALSLDVHA